MSRPVLKWRIDGVSKMGRDYGPNNWSVGKDGESVAELRNRIANAVRMTSTCPDDTFFVVDEGEADEV